MGGSKVLKVTSGLTASFEVQVHQLLTLLPIITEIGFMLVRDYPHLRTVVVLGKLSEPIGLINCSMFQMPYPIAVLEVVVQLGDGILAAIEHVELPFGCIDHRRDEQHLVVMHPLSLHYFLLDPAFHFLFYFLPQVLPVLDPIDLFLPLLF